MRRLTAITAILATAASFAGCAIHPDLLPDRATSLRMAEERRTLPAEERYRHRDAGGALSAGNEVTLLVGGPASFASMIEAVGNARGHGAVEARLCEPVGIGGPLLGS